MLSQTTCTNCWVLFQEAQKKIGFSHLDAHRSTGPTMNPGILSVVPSCPSPCQRLDCPCFSASYIDFFLDGALAGGAARSCSHQRAASWAVVCPPLSDPELNWGCGKDIILISERGGCHLLNSVSWWSHLLWTRLSPALASESRAWPLQWQQVECKPGTPWEMHARCWGGNIQAGCLTAREGVSESF